MPIPVVCPCAPNLPADDIEFLQRLIEALGHVAIFKRCSELSESVSQALYKGKETVEPFPPPVAIPIITHGDKHRPTTTGSEYFDPLPAISDLSCLSHPNKRLVMFLVEEGVSDEAVAAIRSAGYSEEDVVWFPEAYIEKVTDQLAERLRLFEKELRQAPLEYQDPQLLRRSLDYVRALKRSYVYESGFGLVEMRWEIEAKNLPDPVDGYYRFPHRVALRPGTTRAAKARFEKPLKRSKPQSVASLFPYNTEAFCVIRFGRDRTEVDFEEHEESSTDTERLFSVFVPEDTVDQCDTLSYGIMWSKKDMYPELEEYSGLRIQNNVRTVTQSVFFMRSIDGKPWDFRWGPRLHRYGPYDNDLGYIDTEGIWSGEQSQHFAFEWDSQKVARGSVFVVRWALNPKRHKRRQKDRRK